MIEIDDFIDVSGSDNPSRLLDQIDRRRVLAANIEGEADYLEDRLMEALYGMGKRDGDTCIIGREVYRYEREIETETHDVYSLVHVGPLLAVEPKGFDS